MDAVVLAGGYATRLWPITKHRPKMFLPVGETTVIDRIFEELEAEPRINTVYVSTNQRFASIFEARLEEKGYSKPVLSVEQTSDEDEKLGVIGALNQLINREAIEKDLLVIAGDNLISFRISDFIDFFDRVDQPCLAAYDVGSTDRATQYGVVEIENDQVISFEEKPADPPSTMISIACYGFPAETVSRFEAYLDEGNNPDELGWFIKWLVEKSSVAAYSFEEAWFDIGTPASYLDAVAWSLDGGTNIHSTANVSNSDIGSNVHIMSGSTVEDATISNSIIFSDSTIIDCELRRCIIDEGTTIEGIDLAGAVIGAHTHLNNR